MKGLMETDTEMTIGEYCKPTAQELEGFASWYKKLALFGIANTPTIRLTHFTLRDWEIMSAERKADGSTPGFGNQVWTLSADEYQAIVRIEMERTAEASEKEATEKATLQAKVNGAIATAKATGKPVEIRRQVVDCRANGEIDCSFDLLVVSVDSNGRQSSQYSHCY